MSFENGGNVQDTTARDGCGGQHHFCGRIQFANEDHDWVLSGADSGDAAHVEGGTDSHLAGKKKGGEGSYRTTSHHLTYSDSIPF